jgi:hypothetical protein
MSSYSSHIKATDRLYYEALKEYISKDELHIIIKRIMDKYEQEWRSAANVFQINILDVWKPRILFAANERLRLSEVLLPGESSSFDQKYLIPPVSEYLTLTCFDLLGQKVDWMTFDQWIDSGKKKEERDQIISKIELTNFIEASKTLYREYQLLYGVKNSFYNFIDEILDKRHQELLFSSIKIEVFDDYPNNVLSKYFADNEEKKKYLYSIRNNFTHKAVHSTPNEILWPNSFDKDGWWRREELFIKKKNWHFYVNRHYLSNLKEIVKYGIFIKMMTMDKCA